MNKKWYWLLLLPYFAVMWVSSYNAAEPALLGIPFFYWYQLLGTPLSSLVIYIVYRATYNPDADKPDAHAVAEMGQQR